MGRLQGGHRQTEARQPPSAPAPTRLPSACSVPSPRWTANVLSEIAVVGYDYTKFASHPRIDLTSVDQGGRELGQLAAALVLDRLGGRTRSVHESLTPRLVVRGESRAAPDRTPLQRRGATSPLEESRPTSDVPHNGRTVPLNLLLVVALYGQHRSSGSQAKAAPRIEFGIVV